MNLGLPDEDSPLMDELERLLLRAFAPDIIAAVDVVAEAERICEAAS